MWNRPLAQYGLRAAAVISFYAGVVIWLTWPLAASMTSFMPAEGFWRLASFFDSYFSTWVLAHETHALVSASTSFADANIYHPNSGTLFYGPAALGALPLFAPVFLVTGNPALAINVTFLLGVSLTAAAMHMIVRRWTGSDLAGVIGALTVIFNQWLIRGFVPTSPHWAALCLLPLIAYFAATRLHSMRAAWLLLPVVILQTLTDLVHIAPAVFGPLGVLATLNLFRRQTRAAGLRLMLILILALLVLAPLYLAYMGVQSANPEWATQSNWATAESDAPGILPDQLFSGQSPFLLTPVAIGLVALGIAAMLWRRREGVAPPLPGGWAHGALWLIVGGCLAQSPVVLIAGKEFLTPLGYFTAWIPGLEAIRVPSRIGIAGLVGLGILSGVAFAEISLLLRTHLRQNHVSLGISVVIATAVLLFTYGAYEDNYTTTEAANGDVVMPRAYQLQKVPVIPDSFIGILRAEQTPLIQLPFRFASDPIEHARAMYHSISHWRPLLNGYSSYWPAGFLERMTKAEQLPSQEALDLLVEETGLSLIWVRTQALSPEKRAEWLSPPSAGAGHSGLSLVASEGTELLYAVNPPLPAQ